MFYINTKRDREVETVDEFSTRKKAEKMRTEYNFSDPSTRYYVSTKCTKNWREKE